MLRSMKNPTSRDFNDRIINLYNSNPETFFGRVPMLYGDFTIGGIVCVGVNPSYPDKASDGAEKAVKKTMSLIRKSPCPPVASFEEFSALHTARNPSRGDVEKILEIQSLYVKHYEYFKQFHVLSGFLGIAWQHLEIFQVRETSQKKVIGRLKADNKFVEFSINHFVNMVDACRPRAILVANAGAVELLGEYCPERFPNIREGRAKDRARLPAVADVDARLGTHLYDGRIPLFYSSMLTQQRALDVGSRQRLFWHIKYAISQMQY